MPPASPETERSVLCAMLMTTTAAEYAAEHLKPDDFTSLDARQTFTTMCGLLNRGMTLEINIVAEHMRRDGFDVHPSPQEYLLGILDSPGTATSMTAWVELLQEKTKLRTLHELGQDVVRKINSGTFSANDILTATEQSLLNLETDRRGENSYTEMVKRVAENLTKRQQHPSYVTGVPSGFRDLDKITAGFQPGELVVCAARPSMGKTTFMLNIIYHLAVKRHQPVTVFSLEMSGEQLLTNMVARASKIESHKLRSGNLLHEEYDYILQLIADRIYEAPFHIDTLGSITIEQLVLRLRRNVRVHKPCAVFVDYLQLLRGSSGQSEHRQVDVAAMSRGLKILAEELRVPIIALAQLNRRTEDRKDNQPRLSDLRESGAIEQDADVVILLHRWDYYNEAIRPNQLQLHVAKNRNGPTGTCILTYYRSKMWMADYFEGENYE